MFERVIKPWGVTVLNALHRRCEDRFWSSCILNGFRIRYDVYLGRIFIIFFGGWVFASSIGSKKCLYVAWLSMKWEGYSVAALVGSSNRYSLK